MGSYFTLFVRSGGIYFDDGTVGGPHSGGMADTNRTWSSRGSSTRYDGAAVPSAYPLFFTATSVNPSGGSRERYLAFPLRCLSTVLGMWRR